MKEKKFRVYDKKLNQYIKEAEGFHVLGEVMAFGIIEEYLFENKENGVATLERWNDLVLEQAVGLKDKNGKSIYENDIVRSKFKRIWKEDYHVSTVVWNQEWCCYYLNNGVSDLRMRDDREYEVIGTIHEKK